MKFNMKKEDILIKLKALKSRKTFLAGGVILGVGVVITSIAVPLALRESKDKTIESDWDKPLPSVFYETNTKNKYTTDKTQAKGYVAETKTSKSTVPAPTSNKDTIKVDGQTVTATGTKAFDKPLPTGPIYDTGTGTPVSQGSSLTKKWTTDKTQAKGYVAGVTEVKPMVKGVTIPSLTGASPYDEAKWTWKETKAATTGTTGAAAVKPKVGGVTVTSLNGGEPYDATKWTWKQKTAPVAQSNSKFYDLDLGTNVAQGTTAKTKADIIDALVAVKRLATKHGGKKLLHLVLSGTDLGEIAGVPATTQAKDLTESNKAAMYDMIIKEITGTGLLKALFGKTPFAAGVATATDGKWEAEYDGTRIPAYDFTGSTAPNGAPAGFNAPADYLAGSAARTTTPSTSAEYTPSYAGTPITALKQTTGPRIADGKAPTTGFTASADYVTGTAEVKQVDPQPLTNPLSLVGDGDRITIDTTIYTVTAKVLGYSVNGKDVNTIGVYETNTPGEYTTDHKEAKGYVAESVPNKAVLPTTYKTGDTITIGTTTYTHK